MMTKKKKLKHKKHDGQRQQQLKQQHDQQKQRQEPKQQQQQQQQGEEQQTCSVAHSLSRSIAPSMRPASARHTNSSLGDTPIFIQTWFCHLNAYASTNGQHPNEYPNLAFPSSLAESGYLILGGGRCRCLRQQRKQR